PPRTSPCQVSSVKPVLQFDLKYHTGYSATLPLKVMAGNNGSINVRLRVAPVDDPNRTAWLSSQVSAPTIGADAKGSVELSGEYTVGPGRYRVDWMLESGSMKCFAHWNIEAQDRNLTDLPLGLPRSRVGASGEDSSERPNRPASADGSQTYVKVLVNYSPA